MSTSDEFPIDPVLEGVSAPSTDSLLSSANVVQFDHEKMLEEVVEASKACLEKMSKFPSEPMTDIGPSQPAKSQKECIAVQQGRYQHLVKLKEGMNRADDFVKGLKPFLQAHQRLFQESTFDQVVKAVVAKEREAWKADFLESVEKIVDQRIKQAMDERGVVARSESEGGSQKERALRDTYKERIVHYLVHRLVGVRTRKSRLEPGSKQNLTVPQGPGILDTFPPEDLDSVEPTKKLRVKDSDDRWIEVVMWRPVYSKQTHACCVRFLDKVAETYQTEFYDDETESYRKFSKDEIKESAAIFLNNIHRHLKNMNTSDHETRMQAQKKRKRRTDSLMLRNSKLESSPLHQCKDWYIFSHAFRQLATVPRYESDSDPEDPEESARFSKNLRLEVPVDDKRSEGIAVPERREYRSMALGHNPLRGGVWEVVDPAWLKPEYLYACIVLDEWARFDKKKSRPDPRYTPIWRAPSETLLRNPDATSVPLDEGALCPAMIKEEYLTEELKRSLMDDPPVPEDRDSKPTLDEVMKLPEWKDLDRLVELRLKTTPKLKTAEQMIDAFDARES